MTKPVLSQTEDNGLMFWCPGCEMAHRVQHGAGAGPRWTWDGGLVAPTFVPSIMLRWTQHEPSAVDPEVSRQIVAGTLKQTAVQKVCHSFVRGGKIEFLADCTHALAGKTVPLPPWDDEDMP